MTNSNQPDEQSADTLPSGETPYAGLDPDKILDALESVGWECTGHLLALNSYENRVYQIQLNDGEFLVCKFYRPKRWTDEQILEEHRFVADLIEDELPCVGPLSRDGQSLFRYEEFRFAVFPRQGGHAPDIEIEDNLKVLGRTLARIHVVGGRDRFDHRISLGWQRMCKDTRDWVLASEFLPDELRPAYESVSGDLLADVERLMTADFRSLRIHGDCHLGNLLWRDDAPHFVDFDDTVMGPAIQDLWMLLSGELDERQRQADILLTAYQEIRDFDFSELRMIEALRTMRIMHHSAWIGRRWGDPAFPIAFPWFDSPRYWSDQILTLREQQSALSEPPLQLI